MINWTHKEGLIPYVSSPAETDVKSIIRIEHYKHSESHKFSLSLICSGGEELDIVIDDKIRYKNGYAVSIENEAKEWVGVNEEPNLLKIACRPEAEGKKVDIVVIAK